MEIWYRALTGYSYRGYGVEAVVVERATDQCLFIDGGRVFKESLGVRYVRDFEEAKTLVLDAAKDQRERLEKRLEKCNEDISEISNTDRDMALHVIEIFLRSKKAHNFSYCRKCRKWSPTGTGDCPYCHSSAAFESPEDMLEKLYTENGGEL